MSADSQIVLEDHDGFIAGLYHLLWQKNINGETCPGMLLPDLILYKYRIPAYWYFTGSDGSLKRKSKASIVNKKIYADFTKGADKGDGARACLCWQTAGGKVRRAAGGALARARRGLRPLDPLTPAPAHAPQSSPITSASRSTTPRRPRCASATLIPRGCTTSSSRRRSLTTAACRSSSSRRGRTTP